METWQVTLLAAFVGGATALGGTLIAQRGERTRDRNVDIRLLRDAQRERQRRACARILISAQAFEAAALDLVFGYAGETRMQRAERILKPLTEAFVGVNEAQVELLLDHEDDPIVARFHEIRTAWLAYGLAMRRDESDPGDPEAKGTAHETITAGVLAIEKMARERLAALERPI